ncbi:MAG: M48 family metallopeptidase [Prevotellaceae bacterium]|jgi:predicted Zn-dependent protease|nr:M48 family metallopeptidase [Prevotellaceae bacterium]
MKKAVSQLFFGIILFFGIWFGLNQIDFVEFFEIEKTKSQIEEALGDFYIKMLVQNTGEITDNEIIAPVEEIKQRICIKNNIDNAGIELHIVKSGDINAFALPGRHIVVNSALILFCKNPEELAGVMAHEIAHIEKNHIMQKLVKEIGLSTLSAMINSGSGGAESLRILTSTAYDRKMEDQADETGVGYLQKSRINPDHLADFMFRLSMQENDFIKNLTFISTHPETGKRAQKILDLSHKEQMEYIPVLTDSIWQKLQNDAKNYEL